MTKSFLHIQEKQIENMSLRKMNNCLLITDIIFYKQREKNNNLRVRGEINVRNYIFILSHFYKVISLGDI